MDTMERAGGQCELCGSEDSVEAVAVAPRTDTAALCATCRGQLGAETLDEDHLRCLRESAWSEVPAVQVLAVRLLEGLGTPWAIDLREQLWLDEDTAAWAADAGVVVVRDCNGTLLTDGDNVTLIRDLDVKGANFTAKRGTLVKGIRLGEDPGLVEGRVHKTSIYLKTEFLKKA